VVRHDAAALSVRGLGHRPWSSAILTLLALGALLASCAAARAAATPRRYAVGDIVVAYTDHSRLIHVAGRPPQPRTLVTEIRYPAQGNPGHADVRGAPPAKRRGPFPLIVFAHGFDITPGPYAPLLDAWASAGYVVAAPIFPLTNPDAPGGPNESDLVNQPTDLSFVTTRMLIADGTRRGILARLIDRREIAVAGQSDGGSTALAAAYNDHFRDRRIGASIILSGARIPGVRGYDFRSGEPPLLAVQGTGDTSNSPSSTYAYFGLAATPKFLLRLWGAPHLAPYTHEQPYLGVVERVSIAFLNGYLRHRPGARRRMWGVGYVRGVATLSTR
jgi:dienelactone hydrolase